MRRKRGSLEVTNNSSLKTYADSYEDRVKAQKELVELLKAQWKLLWNERYNDKVRAEDVSVNDYVSLSVERGTIIHASRDFKALNFREILEQHMIGDTDRFVQPDAHVGGWNKFVKTKITNPRKKPALSESVPDKQAVRHPKKGGRGWLHII